MARKSTLPEASNGDGRYDATDTAATSRRTTLKLAGLAAAGGASLAGASTAGAHAQGDGSDPDDDPTQVDRLTAPDGDADGRFGDAVACTDDGELLLVGAPGARQYQDAVGTAYVYEATADGWTQAATLEPDDGTEGRFGAAVALDADGETAIVGAPATAFDDQSTGAAYVFERDGDAWTRATRLDADQVEFTDVIPEGTCRRFGQAVALDADGTRSLVGAPLSDRPAPTSGGVYSFVRDGDDWTQTSEVIFGGGDSTSMGAAVALDADGEFGVAGVPNNFPGRTGHLAVFPADYDGVAETTLNAEGAPELNVLGNSAATDANGDLVVGGAPGTTDPDLQQGRAHAFTEADDGWVEDAELVPDDGQVEDECGAACALTAAGDALLVGATAHDAAGGDDAGAAHLFEEGDDWTQTATLQPDDGGQAGAAFGSACALDAAGGTAFVGARLEDTDDGADAGAVYVFDLGDADEAIEVPIEVGPGRGRRPINPRSRGQVPIVIRATDEFVPTDEATGVDVSTIRFGAPDVVDAGGGATPRGDGVSLCDDLFVRVPAADTGFDADDSVGKLVAETHDGRRVVGETEVRIVGPDAGT